MKALNETPINLRAVGITMTLAALAIALVAVAFTAGPAWAQTPPGGSADDGNTDGDSAGYTNLSTYPNPQPCGPGAGDASMQEPHEIRTGHYALFDAYWRTIKEGANVGGMDVPGVGVLHTNLCPPEMVKKKEGRKTVTTRSARSGGMDVDEAIMHVMDKHKATTVATNAEATAGQLSLAEYTEVGEVVNPGDKVWWLQLDDPDTSADETSDLGIGFSTLLLDAEKWGSSMRYKFEAERHPTNRTDVPHFFAYKKPKLRNAKAELVWDSSNPGKGVMELNPGEKYEALQWVFTKPGTYLLWVHLEGDVKKPGGGHDWKAISANKTETSEVKRYTIQVGTTLDETEPPIFGVNLGVPENAPAGIRVGRPIPIYNAEADVLYYDLTGPGHSNFETVVASTDPHAVQIVVAEGASLDYETKKSYELNLSVTDRVDHEHNKDPRVDDVLIVKIDLEDQEPGLKLSVDHVATKEYRVYELYRVDIGATVNLVAFYEPTQQQSGQKFSYQWAEQFQTTDRGVKWRDIDSATGPTWSVSQSGEASKEYRVSVVIPNEPDPIFVRSNTVEILWR